MVIKTNSTIQFVEEYWYSAVIKCNLDLKQFFIRISLEQVLLTVRSCLSLTVGSQRFHHDFGLCRLKTEAVVTGAVTETIYIHIQMLSVKTSLRHTPLLILHTNTIRVRHADPEINTKRALKSVHMALGQFEFSLNKSSLTDINQCLWSSD